MNVLKCDICGKIFEYEMCFTKRMRNGHPVKERVVNKVKLYNTSRPPSRDAVLLFGRSH